MAAHAPVRMPSSEWGGKDKDKDKDRPAFYRSPSSQLRHQAHVNASRSDATDTNTSSNVTNTGNNTGNTTSNSNNPFASKDDPGVVPSSTNPFATSTATQERGSAPAPAPAAASKNSVVESAIESVSQSVKPYLPESIAAYLPSGGAPQCELPSKEVPSGSMVGVGSLPGCNSETSVAKLPDERAMEQQRDGAHRKGHKVHHHKGSHDTHGSTAAAAAAPSMYQTAKNYLRRSVGAYVSGSTTPSELPSKETPGGSLVGVGSLPGTTSEVSVAKLPEERRLEGLPSHETDQEVLGKSGGVGALPGGPNESRVALLPEERIHPQYDAGSMVAGEAPAGAGLGRVKEGVGAGSPLKKSIEPEHEGTRVPGAFEQGAATLGTARAGFGGSTAHPDVRLDPGYHPAELHPLKEKEVEKQEVARTADTSPESEERKKSGFMKKVKGEVKVISGKLSHNERKIEEGKQLKGK